MVLTRNLPKRKAIGQLVGASGEGCCFEVGCCRSLQHNLAFRINVQKELELKHLVVVGTRVRVESPAVLDATTEMASFKSYVTVLKVVYGPFEVDTLVCLQTDQLAA